MRNAEIWKPSKFVFRKGRLHASGDPLEVSAGSRLNTDIIASFFDRYLPAFARGRLVDLGCGKAPLYGAYRPFVKECVCVDWAETLHGREYLDLECDISRRLPFRDGEFDTVILSDVMEHIAQPELLWGEMYRILTAGGQAVMSVPFFYRLHETPHDYYRYSEYALRRFAKVAGFEVLLLEPMGGTPEILADILAKNLLAMRTFGPFLAAVVQSAAALLVRIPAVVRVSEKTRGVFPLGYFLVAGKP